MDQYGISSIVLMENAGRGVADTLCHLGIAGPVVICCGKGNNAGDGFVIARHLEIRGYPVRVLLWADPQELHGDAATNYRILGRTDVPIDVLARFSPAHDTPALDEHLAGAAWIVDALLGTGAQGEPRPPLDAVIDRINAAGPPVLAVDLPSGLDCDTGRPSQHTIRAAHTCTFAAFKPGLLAPGADQYTGTIHLLDIGAPRKLVEELLASPGETP